MALPVLFLHIVVQRLFCFQKITALNSEWIIIIKALEESVIVNSILKKLILLIARL